MGIRQTLLSLPGKIIDFYLEVYRGKYLTFARLDEEHWRWEIDESRKPAPWLRSSLLSVCENSAGATELFVHSTVFGEGPKVFSLSTERCEALENTELRVPAEEYEQPFPTFIIDLPNDYCQAHLVKGGWEGVHAPSYLAIHHPPGSDFVFFVVAMERLSALVYVLKLQKGKLLEECWQHVSGKANLGHQMSESEAFLADKLIRVGLNAALLAATYGMEKQPQGGDEIQRALFQKRLAKGKKNEANRRELAKIPTWYGFSQELILSRRAGSHDNPERDASGKVLQSHWRRGHWAMQPFGPHQSLRKKIFRPAVFVNEYLVTGGRAATETTYREGK